MDKSQFEILAPGGDIESIKAAIAAGADAIYCGLDRFNARNRATNLSVEQLNEVVNIAHQHDCKIFVTLNIIILETEISAVVRMLNRLLKTEIDGIIVQDLGLAYIVKRFFPQFDVHASTQLNTHNEGQILFLKQLGASRVNLSRELNISEIKRLAQFGHQHNVLMEVFVHGSYCIGFSGLCYVSSVRNGASGNRGRCSQPCRDEYQTTEAGIRHPLNMKDNSAYSDLKELADAGVYSLKIEGRIKGAHYVYTTVDNWRRQVDNYCDSGELLSDMTELYTVYNRDFSNGYLQGNISKAMYIDNPRDNSANYFLSQNKDASMASLQKIKQKVYDDKTAILEKVKAKVSVLTADGKEIAEENRNRKGVHESVVLADVKPVASSNDEPELSVLISQQQDAKSVLSTGANAFYQLPSNLAYFLPEMQSLFSDNNKLIPWFPAILIDKDYDAAVEFLTSIKPEKIVLNNTGLALIAKDLGIDWIAGPQLNITNSFALKALKEEFSCSGAFISNEISKIQMKRLITPEGFRLYYSIYHPISIMTSRQCLFQQSVGCKKIKINKGCLPKCSKHTSIINLKDSPYIVDKQKGDHSQLYSQYHYLNTEVLNDMKGLYSDYMVDLREVSTETKVNLSIEELILEFHKAVHGAGASVERIHQQVTPTAYSQYIKGL